MAGTDNPKEKTNSSEEDVLQNLGHPRGTLAVVLIFGALFLGGWLAMYLFLFLKRGVPH
jgi:hypothetical protein